MKRIIIVSALLITVFLVTFLGTHYYFLRDSSRQDDSSPSIEEWAKVTKIEIYILESFPVQVHVNVQGELPDACTRLDNLTIQREYNTYLITLKTTRQADEICAQVIASFEQIIPLDVKNLPAGIYTVNVNGVAEIFELKIDNTLPPRDTLSVSKLLTDQICDTDVTIYGKVDLLGELYCPCFELTSGGDKVLVWYDLMIDENGRENPAVDIRGVHNGDWVIVKGELKSDSLHKSPPEFWASSIEIFNTFSGCNYE